MRVRVCVVRDGCGVMGGAVRKYRSGPALGRCGGRLCYGRVLVLVVVLV